MYPASFISGHRDSYSLKSCCPLVTKSISPATVETRARRYVGPGAQSVAVKQKMSSKNAPVPRDTSQPGSDWLFWWRLSLIGGLRRMVVVGGGRSEECRQWGQSVSLCRYYGEGSEGQLWTQTLRPRDHQQLLTARLRPGWDWGERRVWREFIAGDSEGRSGEVPPLGNPAEDIFLTISSQVWKLFQGSAANMK